MEQEGMNIDGVLHDVRLFLPKLIDASNSTEDLLHSPMTETTWHAISDIVEGMDDLYQTLQAYSASLESADALRLYLEQFIGALSDNFRSMNASLDDDDYIGAADSLHFELIPQFQSLYSFLEGIVKDKDEILKNNLIFLQHKYPNIYAKVLSISTLKGYSLTDALNGERNVLRDSESGIERPVYSRYNPTERMSKQLQKLQTDLQGKTSLVIYGFGLGYFGALLSKTYPNMDMYVYEPDYRMFLSAIRILELSTLFSELRIKGFLLGSGAAEERNVFINHFMKFNKGEAGIIISPEYENVNKEAQKEFMQQCLEGISNYRVGIANFKRYGVDWTRNSLFNLAATLSTPSIEGLKNCLKGMTAVIVGAGPSLEADIVHLKRLKEHAFIIAAGSAIQSLLHYGIEPHLIVSVDGGKPNYDAFKDLNCGHIPLLFIPMIHHRIIDERDGQHLLHVHLHNDWTTRLFLGDDKSNVSFRPTHSVTGTTIIAAIYMGCNDIVFAGQDLSYPEDKMYAGGAKHVESSVSQKLIKDADQRVLNVKGGWNRVDMKMLVTLRDIESLLAEYPDVTFTNTSQMGAKIDYTKWENMDSIVRRHEEEHVAPDLMIHLLSQLPSNDWQQAIDVRGKLKGLSNELMTVSMRLRQLERRIGKLRLLLRTNPAKCLKTIKEIDSDWEYVVNGSVFNALYAVMLRSEIFEFERDLKALNSETGLSEQIEFYSGSMYPLVNTMLERAPLTAELVQGSLSRLDKVLCHNGKEV